MTVDRWAEVAGGGVGACLAFEFQSIILHIKQHLCGGSGQLPGVWLGRGNEGGTGEG